MMEKEAVTREPKAVNDDVLPLRPLRRAATILDPLTTSVNSPTAARRNSAFSDFSSSVRYSTDDLLSPRPMHDEQVDPSTRLDSVPLAFALLPAVGGLLFQNGSSIVTDIMLLGLAAVFLNWSVRVPWGWYHSAQTIRVEAGMDEAITDDHEQQTPTDGENVSVDAAPATRAATRELYIHEMLALVSCFVSPALAAYLLHALRAQLTRPSEGLVSNYNLTIFLLAAEIRPLAHALKLVRARTLHLQRLVSAEKRPLNDLSRTALVERLSVLEARVSRAEESVSQPPSATDARPNQQIIVEIRRTLQPELDALNRAVRRYEKRATLQAFQTDSRLVDLESQLRDAISLAAAAANGTLGRAGIVSRVVQGLSHLMTLPWRVTSRLVGSLWTPGNRLVHDRRKPEKRKAIGMNGRKTSSVKSTR